MKTSKRLIALILTLITAFALCTSAFAATTTLTCVSETPRTSFLKVYNGSSHYNDCLSCSSAWIVRQKGYSAYSLGVQPTISTTYYGCLSSGFSGYTAKQITNTSTIASYTTSTFQSYMVNNFGKGHYGIMVVKWNSTGGTHAVNWVISSTGALTIYDCQSGMVKNITTYRNSVSAIYLTDMTNAKILTSGITNLVKLG